MKPLKLEMQAFGPFARRQVVDFGELGAKTFFLIHGPTGSGKTTILDGICFALFGDSSGGEREGRQMRSHHAEADMLTEVSYEFALGAARYRVYRAPEQMRKARRGGGETLQTQQAELWEIGAAGEGGQETPIASGWQKVTARIVELLGFESRQFRQVIMLPQGRFRDFLMSNSQDRERILQTLFGTELYKRIEEALKRSAAELEKQAETVRTQRQTLLDQAEAASEEALAARETEQQAALAARRSEETAAREAASLADQALAQARLLQARFVERDAAEAALASARAQQPDWQARRLQLAAARKAAQLRPAAEDAERAAKAVVQAAAELERLDKMLASAGTAKAAADAALAGERARAPQVEAAIRRQAELDALTARVASLDAGRKALARAGEALAGGETALQQSGRTLAERQQALSGLGEAQQQARLRAATLPGLQAECQRLGEQLERRRALGVESAACVKLAAAREAAQAACEAARAGLATERRRRDETREAWIAGLAGRLAATLAAGQPCPVCGAADHPAPAHESSAVSDQRLEDAEAALGLAEERLRRAEQGLAAAQRDEALALQRRENLCSALGEAAQSPLDALAAARIAAEAQLAEAATAQRWLAGADAAIAAARGHLVSAEAAQQQAQAALTVARDRVKELTGQVRECEAGVPAELADPQALAQAQRQVQATLAGLRTALAEAEARASAALATLAEAGTRVESARQLQASLASAAAEAARGLEDRLRLAGFADPAAWRGALLDDEAIATLDEAIQRFDATLTAAAARWARAEADTAGLARPDLAARQGVHEQAQAAHLAAGKAVQQADSALAATRKSVEALARLQRRFEALEARYGVLKQVAEVAAGNNPLRMSFQRYVLATLLEEVLAATTQRLRVMSRGRYEMLRRKEPGNMRSAAGLDLEIFDHYTGNTRAAATLSGGESFLASLALALGLSDVVQSYAGGIRLDAIFVDEGFGTLDPESLDYAIRALKDLQQAGRLVGIISHVAELKEWIDARLELKSTPTGSVAAFVG